MFSYLFSSPVCNLSPIVTPSSRWCFPHRKWVLTSHIGFAFCMNTLHFLQAWPFPCEAADTLFPCLVLTPHRRSLPLWIPCHLLCSCRPVRAALPSGLSLPCADWDLMLDYSSLGCLINLTGFSPTQARLPLCGCSLHPIYCGSSTSPLLIPYRDPLHTLHRLWILHARPPLRGNTFFTLMGKTPILGHPHPWMTIMPSHSVWGSQYPFMGLPFWPLLRPDILTSLSCIVHLSSLCSGSDFLYQAKFPRCMYIMFGFLIFIFKLFYQLYLIDVPFFIHLQLCIFSINTLCIPV